MDSSASASCSSSSQAVIYAQNDASSPMGSQAAGGSTLEWGAQRHSLPPGTQNTQSAPTHLIWDVPQALRPGVGVGAGHRGPRAVDGAVAIAKGSGAAGRQAGAGEQGCREGERVQEQLVQHKPHKLSMAIPLASSPYCPCVCCTHL